MLLLDLGDGELGHLGMAEQPLDNVDLWRPPLLDGGIVKLGTRGVVHPLAVVDDEFNGGGPESGVPKAETVIPDQIDGEDGEVPEAVFVSGPGVVGVEEEEDAMGPPQGVGDAEVDGLVVEPLRTWNE